MDLYTTYAAHTPLSPSLFLPRILPLILPHVCSLVRSSSLSHTRTEREREGEDLCTTYARATNNHGVASTSRLLKITGLFCKRALLKRLYSAKETYHFEEPTNRSHPIICTRDHTSFFFDGYCSTVHFF